MKFVKWGICVCTSFALAVTLGFSQAATGSISGTVVDSSGAAIPGAEITVTNQGTSQQFVAVSSAAGSFSVPALIPAFYEIKVSLAGFKTFVARDAKVDVGKTYSAVAILEVGGINEVVTVSSGADLVNTSEAQISNTVTREQILELPLDGRNVLNLISLQAGTANNSRTPTAISGLRTSLTAITQDGVNIQDNFIRANATTFVPNRPVVDQVSEFTTVTQNQGAEYGFGSSNVSLVSPSGTNNLHGSLYWFHRNDVFGANSFFNNKAGIAKEKLIRNQFGASVTGPVYKNKLFFFGFYEGLRLRQQSSRNNLVLTPDARRGVFTYTGLDGQVRKLDILNRAGVAIDPAVAGLLQQLPTDFNNFNIGDSTASVVKNNAGLLFNQSENTDRNQGGTRIDYVLSSRHTFEGVYNFQRESADRPDIYAGFLTEPKVTTAVNDNHFLVGAWKWTLSPTFLNEVRAGGNRAPVIFDTTEDFSAGYKIVLPANTFVNPIEDFERQGRSTHTYTIQDNASWQRGVHSLRFGFQSQFVRVRSFSGFNLVPAVTLGLSAVNSIGLDAGAFPGGISAAELQRANNLLAALGGVTTSAVQEFNVTSRTSGFQPEENVKNWTYDIYAFYFGDTWRVRPRLTLNAGVRWEYYTPLDEGNGLMVQPERKGGEPIRQTVLDPNGQYNFVSGGLHQRDLNNFAPNLGIAWDLFGDGKTSLRAGYGFSYANDEIIRSSDNALNRYGVAANVTLSNLTRTLAQGIPTFTTPQFKLPLTYREIDQTIMLRPTAFAVDPDLKVPYIQSWNFGIQREIGFNTAIEARYVGTKATRLIRGLDFNQVVIGPNGFLDDFYRARSNGFLALSAGLGFNPAFNPAIPGSQPLPVISQADSAGLLNNATIRGAIQRGEAGELAGLYHLNALAGNLTLVPNAIAGVADVNTNGADSIYHGLQTEVRRRFQSGVSFQFNYTFSKVLTNASGVDQTNFEPFTDLGNLAYDRGRAEYDTPHVFNGNLLYELPFGRGRRFDVDNPFLNGIVGGWRVTSILNWQSGSPFSIGSRRGTLNRVGRSTQNRAFTNLTVDQARDLFQIGSDATGPYFVSRSVVGTDGRAVAPDGQPPFSGQVFFNPEPGTLGNLPKLAFTGPAYFNWDFGIIKRTAITENTNVEFRAEFFNLLNHNVFDIAPTSTLFDLDINSPTFGRFTQSASSPRVIQFALKINF